MINIKNLIVVFSTCFLISHNLLMGWGNGLSDGDRAYMSVNKKAIKVLEKKYFLKCMGTGVGDDHGINMMSLSFRAEDEVQVKEARILLLNIAQDYLNIINSDVGFRCFMANAPFDEKNIVVRVFFYKKNGDDTFHPRIAVASIIKGNINYCTNHTNLIDYKEKIKETYEEALEKLKQDEGGGS